MKTKTKTLKNGLRIITVPMKDNPTVTVLVMVEAGTRYETHETNGLSHFLEHMCFKGTKKRSNLQVAYELEAMGAQTNAFTWYDYTGYYAKGRSALFPKLLDVVSDVYLNSTFPETEIEKERGVICGEIDMYEDLPQRKVQTLFAQSLYGNQPAGYTILGPKENIKRFSRSDFVAYHNEHYVAAKTIVVVAGNINTKDVEKKVQEAFKGISEKSRKNKKKITLTKGDVISVIQKKTDQSHIVLGLRTIPMQHPDATTFSVMTAVLGNGMSSRLFVKLREEMGAGYYVRSLFPKGNDYGELEISTGTEPKRVLEVIQAITGEIHRLKTQKVSDQELEKTKAYIIGNLYMGLESSDNVAFAVADDAILHQPLKTPKEREREIRAVTAADVLRVAKKYLKPEKLHLAMIGPGGDKSKIADILQG